MPRSLRLVSALLLALMAAAALGRVALGADTDASVVFSPVFQMALVPAVLAGWLTAPMLGQTGLAGGARAVASMLAVALIAGVTVAVVSGQPPFGLLWGVAAQPHALGALAFGAGAAQLLVRRRQSRK